MPRKELSLSVCCSWHNLMPSLSLADLSKLSILATLVFISWNVDMNVLKFSSPIGLSLLDLADVLICCGERTTLLGPAPQTRACFLSEKLQSVGGHKCHVYPWSCICTCTEIIAQSSLNAVIGIPQSKSYINHRIYVLIFHIHFCWMTPSVCNPEIPGELVSDLHYGDNI